MASTFFLGEGQCSSCHWTNFKLLKCSQIDKGRLCAPVFRLLGNLYELPRLWEILCLMCNPNLSEQMASIWRKKMRRLRVGQEVRLGTELRLKDSSRAALEVCWVWQELRS